MTNTEIKSVEQFDEYMNFLAYDLRPLMEFADDIFSLEGAIAILQEAAQKASDCAEYLQNNPEGVG